MDQASLVESYIDDGRRLVDQLAADGQSIQAAFWAKTEDNGNWFLHVVTDNVAKLGPAAAYRAIDDSLKKLRDCSISISEVKALNPTNRIARDVIALARSGDLGNVAHFGVGLIPNIEEGWMYRTSRHSSAMANQMTTEEVAREVVRLMNRGPGILAPSHVTLKDGTVFSGVPFSLQLGSQQAMVVQFVVDHEHAPRVLQLDEIASIA
ncbi:MAG TPA: hypothetical protein VIK18_10920 [Pirellulales bacterium]